MLFTQHSGWSEERLIESEAQEQGPEEHVSAEAEVDQLSDLAGNRNGRNCRDSKIQN